MFQAEQYRGDPRSFVLPDGNPLALAAGFAQRADGTIVEAGGRQYNDRGELNAWDDQDYEARIQATARHRLRGRIRRAKRSALMTPELKEKFKEICVRAAKDKTNNGTMVLADVVSDTTYEVMRREGLVRNLLAHMNAGYGDFLKIKVDKMDVMAFITLGNAAVAPQMIEQDYIIPAEGEVSCLVTISERVLAQASPDLLDKKYETMLEAFGVREDRYMRFVMNSAAPVYNNLVGFSTFTPGTMTSMKIQVGSWGLPTSTLLVSYDILGDILSDPDWTAWFDPGTKHVLALEGYLETLMGIEIVVDGFRYENIQVLQPGEAYMLTTPAALGTFTEREKLQTKAIDRYALGQMARGWAGFELISVTFGNPRGVCRGLRQ